MSTISKQTMQGLALVKYLLKQAVGESHKPEPFCTTAILGFHDSVELFNELASVHLGDQRKYNNFMDYWQMQLPDGGKLGHAPSMAKLNRLRTGLKHAGIFVRKEEVEDLRPLIEAFFGESAPRAFGIDFDTVSMVDLVQDDVVRTQLGDAEKFIAGGDLPAAMGEISIAYLRTMKRLDTSRDVPLSPRYRRFSRHDIQSDYQIQARGAASHDSGAILHAVGRGIEHMGEEIDELQDILKLLILGINYKDRLLFAKRTPHVLNYTLAGVSEGGYEIRHSENREYTPAECHFCLNFVIECAVSIQNFLSE